MNRPLRFCMVATFYPPYHFGGDAIYVHRLANALARRGHTVIVITHAMPLAAEYCDRIVVMCEGEILLDGPPRDVFAEEKTLAKTFVEPPPVTRLAIQLGLNPVPLTVAEAVDQFAPLMSREAAS